MDLAGALTKLFDYQRFEGNPRLQALIDAAEDRYQRDLSDDDLEWVSAAGEETDPKPEKDGDADE